MNSRPPTAAVSVVAPAGIIPNTYYDNSVVTSCSSTPYTSAPSSPGRGGAATTTATPIVGGYFYSAPSSPMHHFLISSVNSNSSSSGLIGGAPVVSDRSSFEFDFGPAVDNSNAVRDDDDDRSSTMISADELFLNGQIRPMKLSSHLQHPQNLAPLIDVDDEDEEDQEEDEGAVRGRDWKKLRNKSLRRKARSLSPFRTDDVWNDDVEDQTKKKVADEESSKINNPSTSSSRSSSGGTSSKRWVFLKDFIRSKSDGSNSSSTNRRRNAASLWSSVSFSNRKVQNKACEKSQKTKLVKSEFSQTVIGGGNRLRNGIVVSRKSAHEAHYTAKRAQAEEMRRKTFLPYRQGLLGCLGFSSKSYRAMDGLTRTLNSVSSRSKLLYDNASYYTATIFNTLIEDFACVVCENENMMQEFLGFIIGSMRALK